MNDEHNLIPETVENLVVLCHGYGSNGADMAELARELVGDFPRTAFLTPDAPVAVGWGGYEWFNLDDFDLTTADETYLDTLTARAAGVADEVVAWVQEAMARWHLSPNRVVLGGFSQGGLVAFRAAQTLGAAGVIGLSAVPVGKITRAEKPFPILLTHGEADPVVPDAAWQVGVAHLRMAGYPVKTVKVPNLGHGVDEVCLNAVKKFLRQVEKP